MDSRCAESPSPIWSPKRRATLRGRLQLCGGALRGGNVFGDAVDAAAHPRTCPIPEAKLLREPKASLRQQLQFHEFAHRHSAVSIKTARAGRCRTTPNPSLGKRRRLPASACNTTTAQGRQNRMRLHRTWAFRRPAVTPHKAVTGAHVFTEVRCGTPFPDTKATAVAPFGHRPKQLVVTTRGGCAEND